MIQFLAFSKSLLFPSYCYACDEPLQQSICFCQVCQSQLEFLDSYARCDVCFNKLESIDRVCKHCKESRFFDKRVVLFDSLSPVVALVNRNNLVEPIANLFIIGIDHFDLSMPTRVVAEDRFFVRVAREMMRLLNLSKGLESNESIMVIAKESVSQDFMQEVGNIAGLKNLVVLCMH